MFISFEAVLSSLLRTAVIVFPFFAIAKSTAEEAGRPNILWIIAEDMSPDLGCYGNKVVTTPHIDSLAAKGMRFDKVFTTGPACSQSRTALATGVFQTTLGAHHMRYPEDLAPVLPESVKVLPELMRENGYFTGNIKGMGGIGKDDWQFKVRGKSWDTDSWEELKERQPFFAQINTKHSHRPFPPADTIPEDEITIPPYYPDHPVTRNDWAGYFASVNAFDRQVGAILEQLRKDGLLESTIVCVLSDHGRPMVRGKNWLYDSGIRIPLIIRYPEAVKKPPGYREGGESLALLSAIDLVAETVLMAGGVVPDWMQGRGFLRKDSKPRQYVHSAVDRIGEVETCSRAVRSDRFKYIRNFKRPGSINECATAYRRATHPIHHLLNIMGERDLLNPVQRRLLEPLAKEELYDLENDPFETVNLIGQGEFEAVREELENEMSKWIESSDDRGFGKDSEPILEHFNQYGISESRRREKSIRNLRSGVGKHFE